MFLMTDGDTHDDENVIYQYITDHCAVHEEDRFYSIGLSDNCNRELIREVAQRGNGDYRILLSN